MSRTKNRARKGKNHATHVSVESDLAALRIKKPRHDKTKYKAALEANMDGIINTLTAVRDSTQVSDTDNNKFQLSTLDHVLKDLDTLRQQCASMRSKKITVLVRQNEEQAAILKQKDQAIQALTRRVEELGGIVEEQEGADIENVEEETKDDFADVKEEVMDEAEVMKEGMWMFE